MFLSGILHKTQGSMVRYYVLELDRQEGSPVFSS